MELSAEEILQRLIDLPVSSWRYEWEPEGVAHIGPMAQDFATAFGGDETRIAIVDYFGVLLVGIQVLARKLEQQTDDAGTDPAEEPAPDPRGSP